MATSLNEGGADQAALIALGGWSSPDAAAAYIEVSSAKIEREYTSAMAEARRQREAEQLSEVETPTA